MKVFSTRVQVGIHSDTRTLHAKAKACCLLPLHAEGFLWETFLGTVAEGIPSSPSRWSRCSHQAPIAPISPICLLTCGMSLALSALKPPEFGHRLSCAGLAKHSARQKKPMKSRCGHSMRAPAVILFHGRSSNSYCPACLAVSFWVQRARNPSNQRVSQTLCLLSLDFASDC